MVWNEWALQPPQLILLDLLMPVMDGFDFLAELRKNEVWQGIPVVVLTSKDLTQEERQVLSGNVEKGTSKGRAMPARHSCVSCEEW